MKNRAVPIHKEAEEERWVKPIPATQLVPRKMCALDAQKAQNPALDRVGPGYRLEVHKQMFN